VTIATKFSQRFGVVAFALDAMPDLGNLYLLTRMTRTMTTYLASRAPAGEHGGDDHVDPLSFEGICGSFLVSTTRELERSKATCHE
jgi:hypothetical protein